MPLFTISFRGEILVDAVDEAAAFDQVNQWSKDQGEMMKPYCKERGIHTTTVIVGETEAQRGVSELLRTIFARSGVPLPESELPSL